MKHAPFILVVNETMVRRPVFVLGLPHSGIDLVAHAVRRSPGFHVTDAAPPVRRCAHALARRPSIATERGLGAVRILREAFAEAWQLTPYTCPWCSCTTSAEAARQHTAVSCVHGQRTQRYGDASPDLLYSAETLAAVFEDALFIQVIRDGRDVVAGMLHDEQALDTIRINAGTAPDSAPDAFLGLDTEQERHDYERMSPPQRCALRWRGAVRRSAELRSVLPTHRLLTLRYEDIVGGEVETAEQLTAFVDGLVSAPDLVQADRDGIGSWRRTLTVHEHRDVMRTVGADLARLGYD
ncbi:sulfotransferase [Lipingzhangella sp. LS1_29]|uniref:Sulfotransferase n=1 Tax=Lipingzhangella rawalii TaxID=2055835 RepID=A0ABU2HBC2_9ACTN|nr:sulfotransferase [Lipingzhangella rawalii]MDS1272618.1 sulfotransferase [Lipingzhangella rawalii]